jgi:hypothetical protein
MYNLFYSLALYQPPTDLANKHSTQTSPCPLWCPTPIGTFTLSLQLLARPLLMGQLYSNVNTTAFAFAPKKHSKIFDTCTLNCAFSNPDSKRRAGCRRKGEKS